MRVKKLIEWLSEDFQPDDVVFVQLWGRDLFTAHNEPDTDDELPNKQVWQRAVEATENDRGLDYITASVYDMIDDNLQIEERKATA